MTATISKKPEALRRAIRRRGTTVRFVKNFTKKNDGNRCGSYVYCNPHCNSSGESAGESRTHAVIGRVDAVQVILGGGHCNPVQDLSCESLCVNLRACGSVEGMRLGQGTGVRWCDACHIIKVVVLYSHRIQYLYTKKFGRYKKQ